MKTLIIVKEREYVWIQDVIPSRHPLLAPVCNKPLLSYWIDFAIQCGSREIRLVSDGPTSELEKWFGNGDRWGVELTYAPIRETDKLEEALQKNSRFCLQSRLLVLQGYFFLHYDKGKNYKRFMQAVLPGDMLTCPTGRILIRDSVSAVQSTPVAASPPLALVPLRSLNDFHQLSLQILASDAHQYVLPGYNNEAGFYIGRNVMIAKTAQITPPVMIGDHVQIRKGAVVGPDVVIGNQVIIDDHSRVRDSVILDKTYVGGHLDLDQKVAHRGTLVDPRQETVVNMEDPRLLSEVDEKPDRRFFHGLFHGFLAVLLAMIQAIPYVLLSFILKRQGRWCRDETVSLLSDNGKVMRHTQIIIDRSGFAGRLAKGLALDRFPLLSRVVSGKLKLIGHRLLSANDQNRKKLYDGRKYQPGVFSYAEGENWPVLEADQEFSEFFHMSRRTFGHDFVMVCKALLNRMNEEDKI